MAFLKGSVEETSEGQDTFAERVQMQIMRNIELQIKDIHVRYEDDCSKPDHPFTFGFTLSGIEIKVKNRLNSFYLKLLIYFFFYLRLQMKIGCQLS